MNDCPICAIPSQHWRSKTEWMWRPCPVCWATTAPGSPSTPIRTSPTICREMQRGRSAASWKRPRPSRNRNHLTRRRRTGARRYRSRRLGKWCKTATDRVASIYGCSHYCISRLIEFVSLLLMYMVFFVGGHDLLIFLRVIIFTVQCNNSVNIRL